MIDRKKVIAALEKACRDSAELPPFVGLIEITKEAIEEGILPLLREQEPVKPISRSDMYFCGACRTAIARTVNFCPKCGKAVDWNAAD